MGLTELLVVPSHVLPPVLVKKLLIAERPARTLRRMVTEEEVAAAVVAMLHMPGLCGADIDLSAGMVAR